MNTRMNSQLPNNFVPPFTFPFLLRFPPINGMPIFPNGIPFPYSMFMDSQRLREPATLDVNRDTSVRSSSSGGSPLSVIEKGFSLKWIHGAEPECPLAVNFRMMSNELLEGSKNLQQPCDRLTLLIIDQDEVHFYACIYSNSIPMNPGETLEIPKCWKDLCKMTSNESEANLSFDGNALKMIKFGSEIVIFKSKPSQTLEKARNLKVGKEDDVEEASFTTSLSANLNLNTPRQFSIHAAESLLSEANEDSGHLNQPNSESGYQCERCGKTFTYSYYRDKHLKYTRCVDNGDRKFPCPLCTRSFEKRDRLRIHILHVHENHRPHVCSICNKAFSQSSSLNKHLRVHSGERPYACPFCSKSFTASSILRTHIRQHSGEKPFKCAFCGRSFASHAAHDSHVRRTHSIQETENLYKCQTCDKCFDHPSHLNFHTQCVHNI